MKTVLKRSLLLFFLSGWIALSNAQELKSFSLDEAIRYAFDNSLTLKNAQIGIADAQQQVYENRSIGIPQVSGGVALQRYLAVPVSVLPEGFENLMRDPVTGELPPGFSREVSFLLKNNLTASLNVEAMVFDGTYFVALKASKAYKDFKQKEYASQKRTVQNSVVDAYLPALLITENLKILDKNISNIENLFFETQEMYKAGFVEQLDVDRLELTISNLKTERENLDRQRETAANALKFAIGYPMNQELKITDRIEDLLAETTQEDLTGAINYSSRPEHEVANMSLVLNDLNIKRYKTGYLPSLRAFGSYQHSYLGNSFSDGFWSPTALVGLNLNVPIFDGFQKRSLIERSRLDGEIAKNQIVDLERAISFEVTNARTMFTNAQKRVNSQKKNVELAEKIYETTQIKYREGIGSSLEINQAEQSLFDTQSNYITAMYDLLIAQKELEKALGE